jgi:hypothetical protein
VVVRATPVRREAGNGDGHANGNGQSGNGDGHANGNGQSGNGVNGH